MARVTFSPLFVEMSGKLGDAVMSRWKGIPYVRSRVTPANPQSGDQCNQRYCLKASLLLWQSIKALAKAPWDLAVTGYAISGYNKFMDECIAALIPQFTSGATKEDPTWTDPAVTVGLPYNKLYPALIGLDAGTPAANEVVFTWTARDGAVAEDQVHGWYRLDNATAWTKITNVLDSAETITFAGLTDALQYEFMLAGYRWDLNLYSLSTHRLQTPGA